jgi:sugar (pentulose or hexulose) kinase
VSHNQAVEPAQTAQAITEGRTALGIELGSTRIKAALITEDGTVIATGGHDWENQFVDRLWTYSEDAIWSGLQACYADLATNVQQAYGVPLRTIGAIGFSAMMHGYLAFNQAGQLLVPFRTWRNTNTGPAAAELSALFHFNIPLRWSIAHLYQAILNEEPHVKDVAYITTLAGYVHWKLTGAKVVGADDASGMFPIDSTTKQFNRTMLNQFDELVAPRQLGWRVADVLPQVLVAGQPAGGLTPDGARLLDPSGSLQPGIPCAPPEGDAGTGMTATNSVAPRTGNTSAGTSIFTMVVLEHELTEVHHEVDMVVTPSGDPVAMVHCNNGASELGEWGELFGQFAAALGAEAGPGQVFEALFKASLQAEPDAGGLLAYNYLAGEPITGTEEGRPLFVRTPDSRMNLANFMRAQLYAAFGTLKLGMDVLNQEGVRLDAMFGHGGIFKTEGVAQRYLAAALGTPVTVGQAAGEGGAWGMALLAAFLVRPDQQQSLPEWLAQRIFTGAGFTTLDPVPDDVAGFAVFMDRYRDGLAIERAAIAAS